MHGLFEYITVAAFMLSVVKMLLNGRLEAVQLDSHGYYIVGHGKDGKIMELCF